MMIGAPGKKLRPVREAEKRKTAVVIQADAGDLPCL